MLRNYFLAACRNFWRNKTFSVINVLGLSIGIGAALVIFLIVHHELSYDNFQKDKDRIYRAVMDIKFGGMEGHSSAVPAPLSDAIRQEVTGVDQVVPLMQFQGDATAKVKITRPNATTVEFKKQPDILFTSPDYFQVMPRRTLAGNLSAALKEPFSVVLCKKRAEQYFPGLQMDEVVGQQISYNDNFMTVTVKAVVEDQTELSSFNAEEFISFATIEKTSLKQQFMMDVWNDWMAYSQLYIKISSGSSAERVASQINSLYNKYNKNARKDDNNYTRFQLQPLATVHFDGNYAGFGQRLAHKSTLYGLLAVGMFLLLLGCINFINLTTANAAHRAKEIGVRKTIGSSRKQLLWQFLGETFFITCIATLLSVAITPILLNMFEGFIPPGLKLNLLTQPILIAFLLLLTLTVSFLAGLYPAIILSGFKPVSVLKNQVFINPSQTRRLWLRKSLTVSQFVIAQFFIIATVAVSKQINFSIHSEMGFKSEAVLNFHLPRDTSNTRPAQLKNQISNIPGVARTSLGFLTPADDGAAFGNISFFNSSEEIKPKNSVQVRWGDTNYISLYNIQLVAGRNVMASDTLREFLVNETFAHEMGFANASEIVNQNLKWNNKVGPIVGVMKDFHDLSMRANISPIAFGGQTGTIMHVKLAANNADGSSWRNAIAKMQEAFTAAYPAQDFAYTFLDEKIASFYKTEQNTASLLKWSTGLTIFISCLGLLGLVMYTTSARAKEISIRKILGANVASILRILSKDFLRLVLISFAIAAPLAWWAINNWLQDYSYRFELSVWMFIGCGLALLAAAVITLSFQIVRAATGNPVKSLRSE